MRERGAAPVLTRDELAELHARVRLVWRAIWADAVALMAFSAHVGAGLVAGDRPETQPMDYLLPVTIDAALCIGLVCNQVLSKLGVGNFWGRALCWFTAIATLGLNVGGSLPHPAMVAVHAITPVLLVFLTETAQSISTKIEVALAVDRAAVRAREAAERLAASRSTRRPAARRRVDTHLDTGVDSPGGQRGVDTPLDTPSRARVSTPGVHDQDVAPNSGSGAVGNAAPNAAPRRPQLVVEIPDDVLELLVTGSDPKVTQAGVARNLGVSTKTIQRRVNDERERRGIGQDVSQANESGG